MAVIAGAGFSRAISPLMPLTDELGHRAASRAQLDATRWTSGSISFESWLSRLAEDQPDLPEARNLENRSVFVRLTEAVAEELVDVERFVVETAPPAWLLRFVGLLHATKTPMVTFNYDSLVEQAVHAHELTDWSDQARGGRISAGDIVDHIPPIPPGRFAAEIHSTFRLLKLHGSLDWWWVPGDESAATLVREPLWREFGVGPSRIDQHLSRELVGRSRFIVPPMALKASYYTNPVTRELWRRAGAAIASSERVALIGYSLPLTDLSVTGMLVDHLAEEAELVIVNPDPGPVMASLARLGVEASRITAVDGQDAIATFVDELEAEVCASHARDLTSLDEDLPLIAAWSPGHGAAIVSLEVDGDSAVLTAEPPNPDLDPFRARSGSDATPIHAAALRESAKRATRIQVKWHSGAVQDVVQHAEIARETGYSTRWMAIVPAGGPTEAGYRRI